MTSGRLVDVGEPAQRSHDVEAVTVAEDTRHGDRSGELLEVLGGRVVGHLVDDDVVALGSTECFSVESDGAANVAIARGLFAGARAGFEEGDSGNRARATGDGTAIGEGTQTFAVAGDGDGNTAIATGDGTTASTGFGDGNTATATGDGAYASAGIGDGNTAIATGDGAYASAGIGDGNSATATGVCTAEAFGTGQTIECP